MEINIDILGKKIQSNPLVFKQGSNEIDTVNFIIPATNDGLNLNDFSMFVEYTTEEQLVGEKYNDTYYCFPWKITNVLTKNAGSGSFNLKLVHKTDEKVPTWYSDKLNYIVEETISCSDSIVATPSERDLFLQQIAALVNKAAGYAETAGKDGREVVLQSNSGYIQWKYKDNTEWNNLIALSELKGADGKNSTVPGPVGPAGKDGKDGESIVGPIGPAGSNGVSPTVEVTDIENGHHIKITAADGIHEFSVLNGVIGRDGKDGKDAYQSAVDNGFTGTEAEWIESLKSIIPGPIGPSGKDGVSPVITTAATEDGYKLTITDAEGSKPIDIKNGRIGPKGADGKDSTVPGPVGESAYQVAVDNGFAGTQEEWLESLKGADGKTPEKYMDYWTEQEQDEIVNRVLELVIDADDVPY